MVYRVCRIAQIQTSSFAELRIAKDLLWDKDLLWEIA